MTDQPASETILRPDPGGWQTLAQGLALGVALLAPLWKLLLAARALRRLPVLIDVTTEAQLPGTTGVDAPMIQAVVEVVPSANGAWVVAGVELANGIFMAVVAWGLYRILLEAQQEPGPFRNSTSKRLARLAWTILVGGFVLTLLNVVPDVLLDPLGPNTGGYVHFGRVGTAWLALGAAALLGWTSMVLLRGEELEDDVDGLV